ncbi:hypothetical protein EZS27_020778 [termite gut metagenome]|uniref:Tc1-like transposase DDE domain-containing protein n=1 Tax=termite gut metagenome TaxID=433724 RepID=A0A5J4RCT3_9ZZZZ
MGYSWKRARLSLKMFRNQERFDKQQQEIKSLMKLDKKDYIDLYFGDESHFGLVPNVPYAWQSVLGYETFSGTIGRVSNYIPCSFKKACKVDLQTLMWY